jgi:hypothetical protein
MARHSGKTIVDRAAEFLSSKGECTPAELNDYLAVGNYASKYVLYMKIAGHNVDTVKNGRNVVKYVYVSGPVSAASPAAKPVKAPAAKPVKAPAAKPVKAPAPKPKAVKTDVVADDKPVMDHSIPTSNRYNLNTFDKMWDINGNLTAYSVDGDWDEVPSNLNLRELGV